MRSLWHLARFLYVQRVKGFDVPSRPHVDAETAEFLADQLKRTKLFLEFGSGGSTILCNSLGVPGISVESDRFFAAAVRDALPDPRITRIIVPRMGLTREWGMPVFRRRKKGRRYVEAPFERLDGLFPDLIFVDGRYRVACALMSARKAAAAAAGARLLMDDYSGRPEYHVLEDHLGEPDRIGRSALFRLGGREVSGQLVDRHSTDPR